MGTVIWRISPFFNLNPHSLNFLEKLPDFRKIEEKKITDSKKLDILKRLQLNKACDEKSSIVYNFYSDLYNQLFYDL